MRSEKRTTLSLTIYADLNTALKIQNVDNEIILKIWDRIIRFHWILIFEKYQEDSLPKKGQNRQFLSTWTQKSKL